MRLLAVLATALLLLCSAAAADDQYLYVHLDWRVHVGTWHSQAELDVALTKLEAAGLKDSQWGILNNTEISGYDYNIDYPAQWFETRQEALNLLPTLKALGFDPPYVFFQENAREGHSVPSYHSRELVLFQPPTGDFPRVETVYCVNLGGFLPDADMETTSERLKEMGYSPLRTEFTSSPVGSVLQCAQFQTEAEARSEQAKLRKLDYGYCFVSSGRPYDPNFIYSANNSAALLDMVQAMNREWMVFDLDLRSKPSDQELLRKLVEVDLNYRFHCYTQFLFCGSYENKAAAEQAAQSLTQIGLEPQINGPYDQGEWFILASDPLDYKTCEALEGKLKNLGYPAYTMALGDRAFIDPSSLLTH